MAELNLKQIIDRLNAEFTGETRKLVFWYDDKAEFAEDMETVELQNAKIYHLQPDNQFYTKYFLERVDKTTNYLIYAPFPKPDVRDNHLEDTMLYSRRFFADRASLLSVDLGIEEKYKPVIEKHIKFFANKERTQRFYDLEIENFNEENILVGLLSAVCKARTCSFEEVVRIVLTDGELVDNAFLQEFEKYDLLSAFWQLCEQHFGYTDTKPSLERLLVTLFVTYTGRYVQAELPAAWKSFVSYKSGNIIAFLDSLMNSVLYRDKYDALSAHVAKGLNVFSAFAGMRVDDLVECDTFLAVDQVLVKWLISRLVSEDIGAIVNGFTIPELCEKRAKMHFGRKTGKTYQLLSSAYSMVKEADYHAADGLKSIIDRYLAADYNMDQQYRKFYYYYDQLESTESFEPLRELVENIYTNEYLACLLPAWNAGIQQGAAFSAIPLQREFYNANLRYTKERTVIIISDAMRYEVGQELFARMQDDPKCTAKLSVQLSVLPSYTRLGMAALLPHKTLEMTDDFQVLADGILCDNLAGRQQVLQSYNPDSVCVQFDDIKNLKVAELRDVLTKRQIIYVYHNQIDARGDKANTEDEVFNACEEAVQEIVDEQVKILLDTIRGLPPYVFVMIGLYAGLRREEILALRWDCVFLDGATPYISVRRAWRSVNNRPVISTELKTPAAKRDIPIPGKLVECLKEAKEKSKSEYVISDRNGNALAESQFVRVWKYIAVRSTEERCYYTYVNGQKIKHVVKPKLGEHQPNNPKLVYTMDFQVTPHQLRHTYITNLIYASVDPKTVQYLAGHENSKVTMDIYAKVKYNKPAQLHGVINRAIDTSKKD